MVEYVDKSVLHQQLDYFMYGIDGIHKFIDTEVPTADVVERSKIDKAIEEIKQEIQNGTIKITSGNEKLFNILENIGE